MKKPATKRKAAAPKQPRCKVVLDMPAPRYHSDPGRKPSLSASIASLLLRRSEAHAKLAHPKLNRDFQATPATDAMDEGSALHTLFLGQGTEIVRIGAKDWRQEWARDKRDRARAEGKVPLLAHRIPALLDCANALRAEIADWPEVAPELLGQGNAEVSIFFHMGGVPCRSRVDWMPDDPHAFLYDLKFTGRSAEGETWERAVWEDHYIQAEFLLRAAHAARGVRPPGVRFIVAETSPPYGVAVLTPGPDVMTEAALDLDAAVTRWSKALETGVWPGYPRRVGTVVLPAWKIEQVTEKRYVKPTPEQIAKAHQATYGRWLRTDEKE